MALRRGFKSEAERIADRIRRDAQLSTGVPVTPEILDTHLGVEIIAGDDLVPQTRFEELRALQVDAFSACTLSPSEGRLVVVYNPLSKPGRRNSDVAHELAHILLGHEFSRIETVGNVTFRSCDPQQEEEAAWLAGCLLLPRGLLLQEVLRQKSAQAIAKEYQVSQDMAEFRIRVTGVRKQAQRMRRPRAMPRQIEK